MVDRGLHANIGAHGEPPLGLNYHKEMLFTQAGGMSNYEVSHPDSIACNETIEKGLSVDSTSRNSFWCNQPRTFRVCRLYHPWQTGGYLGISAWRPAR